MVMVKRISKAESELYRKAVPDIREYEGTRTKPRSHGVIIHTPEDQRKDYGLIYDYGTDAQKAKTFMSPKQKTRRKAPRGPAHAQRSLTKKHYSGKPAGYPKKPKVKKPL